MHALIGVDMGGTKIEAAALDAAGCTLARERAATPKGAEAKAETARALVEAVEARISASALPVGIGHPGSINPRTGRVRNANSTDLNGVDLKALMEGTLKRPVRLANDADCFALSEAIDGAGAEAASVFGVILGTGVGGGIVIERRLWTGLDTIAGEWGHTPLPWPRDEERPGPDCFCGKQGCVETWCSGPALSADLRRVTGIEADAKTIAQRAGERGGPEADALERWLDRLARSLAVVVNILDPHMIVLGGGLSDIDGVPERLQAALASHVCTDEPRTKVRRNAHGAASGVRGAAWLWREAAR